MDTRDVVGIRNLKFAVVLISSNVVISVHQHPDGAEAFRQTCAYPDDFEVVELQSAISYLQR